MPLQDYRTEGNQVFIHTDGETCSTTDELMKSGIFPRVLNQYLDWLAGQDSPLLEEMAYRPGNGDYRPSLLKFLKALAVLPIEDAVKIVPGSEHFLAHRGALHQFIEEFYNYWRSFDRFMIDHSEHGPDSHDKRPYRTFNATINTLTHLVRGLYRDLAENITGDHPRVYRQVPAGCNVGIIAVTRKTDLPASYAGLLGEIPFIRQVLIVPPLILYPPMNRRSGRFREVDRNPLDEMKVKADEWLCYPALVGPLTIFIYFHQRFMGLGCALANLFELAPDSGIRQRPDAVFLYGAPPASLARFDDPPTVFYADEENGLLVGAVPGEDRFGYFGYLKKMTLTLHNTVMMRRGMMPFHGALVRIVLRDGKSANLLLIGDTATGKSESLEAFRILGRERIRQLRIVADDMGSLSVDEAGRIIGRGTEIGAFVRLDDLQKGYAFGQIDRAIIMSPDRVNARVVMPVTTIDEILAGYPIDFLLYANNYEEVDPEHAVIERFASVDQALAVFREGAAMSKGTTSSTGIVHGYFANPFGPPQQRDLHERLARTVFETAFRNGIFVGQVRTRLGIEGFETDGPQAAAESLLELIARK